MSEDYYKTLIKGIIENNDKEEAIKIIANNLNKKQIANEKEILANIEKAIEIERLKKELEIEQDISDGMLETIDEAIEYIEKNTKEGILEEKKYFYSPEQANDILKILKKEENNEPSDIDGEIN